MKLLDFTFVCMVQALSSEECNRFIHFKAEMQVIQFLPHREHMSPIQRLLMNVTVAYSENYRKHVNTVWGKM